MNEELISRLRCPRSHLGLSLQDNSFSSEDGQYQYPITDGVPDLFVSPERVLIDLPWYDGWDELGALTFERPEPLHSDDLPYHLDPYLASVPGDRGDGRWIVEIGCGERQCDSYFSSRGFNYLGLDGDHRGIGPHILADAHNLPLKNDSVDFYTSMAVYEHLAYPLVAAQEAIRILKPGGTIFGTAAFVYGFHDRASFNHLSHAGLLWMLRSVGFDNVKIWPDWKYTESIPEMGFRGAQGLPWRVCASSVLKILEWSFIKSSKLVRRVVKKKELDLSARQVETAGSLTFTAHKPGETLG